jgi:hypothetical protein
MSTKAVISNDDDYTLYREIFDDQAIYLQIENCSYKVNVNYYHGEKEEQVTVVFPAGLWEKIVSEYQESK